MSSTLPTIRRLRNYQLFRLKLVRTEDPVTVVAVLTELAVYLGVRFDNARKDYRFNLSDFLANDDAQWSRGTHFEKTAKNIKLDLSDRENRCLVADLEGDDGGVAMEVKYNLDEVLGLVDYFHPDAKETYFRLGEKARGPPKRTLVLCFDGTSNHFSKDNTNVVKLFQLLKKDDPERQMVYYQTGVGTYTSPAWTNTITQAIANTMDQAVAWYLYQHVIDGYKFLMQTYRDGDRIFLFGYSRGAYTARALAGMLHSVGLLPAHNFEHVPFAYEIYASGGRKEGDSWWKIMQSYSAQIFESIFPLPDDSFQVTPQESSEEEPNEEEPNEDNSNKEDPDTPVPDEEVSEDIAPSNAPEEVPPPKQLPEDFSAYDTFETRGALADAGDSNSRKVVPAAYKLTYCTPVTIDFVGVWDTVGSLGAITSPTLPYIDYNPSIMIFRHALALDEHRSKFVPSLWDHRKTKKYQNVREVWFRGQHSDIGGSTWPPKDNLDSESFEPTKLGNIPLRWMVQQCFENSLPVAFDYRSMQLYRMYGVLEYRPAQPDLDGYKNNKLDLSEWDIDQIKQGSVDMPKELRSKLFYENAAQLDKLDIKIDPHESAGIFSAWNIFEFIVPSARPVQTKEGPTITYWLNARGPRTLYWHSSHPVYLHASVVDFLLDRGGFDYKPSLAWMGLGTEQFPRIESYEGNKKIWPSEDEKEALREALDMGWNRSPGWWARLKEGVVLCLSGVRMPFEFWSTG